MDSRSIVALARAAAYTALPTALRLSSSAHFSTGAIDSDRPFRLAPLLLRNSPSQPNGYRSTGTSLAVPHIHSSGAAIPVRRTASQPALLSRLGLLRRTEREKNEEKRGR
jgi:hypothetical protein